MRRILRRLALLAGLALAPLQVAAQDLSAEIAAEGIGPVRERLAALEAPTEAETFALGGLTFLSGIEAALQTRYRHAFNPSLSMVPVLRLTVPPNPAPEPFRPEVVGEMVSGLEGTMAEAEAILARIPEGADFGLDIAPEDMWFDIDGNGSRGKGESLYEVVGPVLFSRTGFNPATLQGLKIRFDVADSRWLGAYAALVGSVGLAVEAYDPTEAIAEVMEAKARLGEINAGMSMANALDMNLGAFADAAVAIQRALAQEPDRDKAAAARESLLRMVRLNRDFWRLAALETDDEREWIPNDSQTSALGLRMPEGTGATWLAVLDDAEKLLNGEMLLPYWRLGEGAGLNLRRMFEEPRPVDLFAWVQGLGALPYAETGTRISPDNWRRFDQLMQGRGMLFAALLN